MQKNMGGIDRLLRAIVGVVLITCVFVGPQIIWGWIGVVPLVTAVIGWCPAYLPFGFKTCKAPQDA